MPCDAREDLKIGEMEDNDPKAKPTPEGEQKAEVLLDSNFLSQGFKDLSKEVAKDIIYYVCNGGGREVRQAPNSVSIIMRHLVDDTLKERTAMMRDLVLRLNIQERGQLHLLDNVASSMFDDDINWGRIVTLHAFCAYVAKYCKDVQMNECIDEVTQILSNFVINRLGLWMVTQGGWEQLEKQFPNMTFWSSSGLWKMLLLSAIFIGIVFAMYSGVKLLK